MYINNITYEYPISEQAIRNAYPLTSFPVPFSPPPEFLWVFPAPIPPHDPITQGYRETAPMESGGQYAQTFEVYDLTQEQVEANQEVEKKRVFEEIRVNTEKRLNQFAQERLYTDITALCSYATSSKGKYKKESGDGVTGRDDTWEVIDQIMADVQAGTRPVPTGYAEIESELPDLVWSE